MKNFFGSQLLYFILWAGVCYLVHRYIGPFWVLLPLVGGLFLWFWLGRNKPTKGPGATLLLLPLLAAYGCAGPTREQLTETHTAAHADTVWASAYQHAPANVERVGEFDQPKQDKSW